MTATFSLDKAYADCRDWETIERESRPLWWDDASYIRYQSDDGPQGVDTFELRSAGNGAPIVRGFIPWEYLDEAATAPRARVGARDLVSLVKVEPDDLPF